MAVQVSKNQTKIQLAVDTGTNTNEDYDFILAKNIFFSTGGELKTKYSAQLIQRIRGTEMVPFIRSIKKRYCQLFISFFSKKPLIIFS